MYPASGLDLLLFDSGLRLRPLCLPLILGLIRCCDYCGRAGVSDVLLIIELVIVLPPTLHRTKDRLIKTRLGEGYLSRLPEITCIHTPKDMIVQNKK